MKKTIYLLTASVASVLSFGAFAQTPAHRLYDAGQWAAARYEFGKAPLTVETETFAALCAARLEDPSAGDLLADLLEKYPASPYRNEVRFRAGVFEYDRGDPAAAQRFFSKLDPERLPKGDRDEFRFKSGHSLFLADSTRQARSEFAAIAPDSPYRPHADYYTAYMDYSEGNYPAAKQTFTDLSTHPSYERLVPYYLLQIEFLEGNYPYVAENAPALIPATAMPRRAELAKMAAQSWFRLEDYDRALAEMERYLSEGGEMGRSENYLAGYSLYRKDRIREAADYLSKTVGPPDSLSQNASYHLADAWLRLGDKQRALQSFSIAADSGHDPVIAEDALYNYGKLLYDTDGGRFNEAVNVLTRYLDTYPTSPHSSSVREYLIAAYYNSHDYEAAYLAIMQHPDPDNNVKAALQKITYFRALEYLDEGDTLEAARLLDVSSGYRYNPKYTALAAFWQGEILYSQGDFPAARAKYEEYLRLSPTTERENTMARYNLGYTEFNLGQWASAGRRFDDFLSRHTTPDRYRADAFNRRGDVLHAGRSYWQAIESYDKAAAVGTPEKYYSAYQRALMLGLVDRPERKIESLRAIITNNEGPRVEDATYELGRTYIARADYTDGARTLTDFITRYPSSEHYLPALSNLGLAYLNMGDRDRSMGYYKMIVEAAPWSREATDAMAGIRSIYVDEGDIDGYFAYAEKAGVSTDTGAGQRDSLTFAAAERLYLSGDGARAAQALEGYISSMSKGRYVPAARDYLSGLYFSSGRYDRAAEMYRLTAGAAGSSAARTKAWDGLAASILALRDPERILALAGESGPMSEMSEKSSRSVRFAAAGVMRDNGRTDDAFAVYETLATDPGTAEGAESAFRVIEHLYDRGDLGAAEQAVFALSDKGTPHGYWLGEAFLVLGDIYVREGDTFQARATFQSIVDGYTPSDDGIVAAARERIANLK